MDKRQVEIIKQKLEQADLDGEDYEAIIDEAADVCLCMAEMYEETEPCARSAISNLKDAHSTMSSAVSGI